MASIIGLAPELMQQILDYSDPASHLNLALACKDLRDRLDFILRHHQLCHTHYRTASDIHPSTIPRLIRGIIIKGDWIAAWHFQSIEIWGSRSRWEDWKSYELIGPDEGGQTIPSDPDAGASYGPDFFTEHELDRFREFIVKDLGLGVEGVDWLDHIKSGRDDVLKVLLIAACSRLHAVRFIRGSREIDFDTLSSLGVAIKSVCKSGTQSDSRKWPPGFASVREMAVGVFSRALPGVAAEVKTDMDEISPLFLLPALRSLYIHGFSDERDIEDITGNYRTDPNEYWGLPIGSSPIEDLCFDAPHHPKHNPMKTLITSCGKMKHLTFQNGEMDAGSEIDCDQVIGWTGDSRSTLKSLLWCGTSVHGYRTDMFYPEDYNNNHVLTVSAQDIILCGLEFQGNEENIEDKFIDYVTRSLEGDRVFINYEGTYWPCSELLWERALIVKCRESCWGSCNDGAKDEEEEKSEDDTGNHDDEKGDEEKGSNNAEDKIMDIADDENDKEKGNDEPDEDEDEDNYGGGKLPCGCAQNTHINYPYYPEPAPALYLEGVDPWVVPEGRYPWTTLSIPWVPTEREVSELLDPTRRPYGELIRLCKQWGVEIYTRTIKAPRVYSDDMPIIASEKDIETSPWFKHPDVERLYFKPHKGMVDDCGNCGACEDCYKLYPPELWAAWKEEDERLEAEKRARDAEENHWDGDDGEEGDEEGGEDEDGSDDQQQGERGEDEGGSDDQREGEQGEDDDDDNEMRDVEE